jgi:hypothetical protein
MNNIFNYFQGNNNHPQHVSVGAILVNGKNEICCHHFDPKILIPEGYWKEQGLGELYILMRETVEPNEKLEETLHRGLMEEFGAEAKIVDYIGSIQSYFKNKGSDTEIQKTTLYFLCKLRNQDLSKRGTGDVEFESQLEWHPAGFLIPKMKEQSARYGRTDIDESQILERLKTLNSV